MRPKTTFGRDFQSTRDYCCGGSGGGSKSGPGSLAADFPCSAPGFSPARVVESGDGRASPFVLAGGSEAGGVVAGGVVCGGSGTGAVAGFAGAGNVSAAAASASVGEFAGAFESTSPAGGDKTPRLSGT